MLLLIVVIVVLVVLGFTIAFTRTTGRSFSLVPVMLVLGALFLLILVLWIFGYAGFEA